MVNTRQDFKIVEALPESMELEKGDTCHYDPQDIIARRREKSKASTYAHEPKSEIEWKANFDSWPLNTEMETKYSIST